MVVEDGYVANGAQDVYASVLRYFYHVGEQRAAWESEYLGRR